MDIKVYQTPEGGFLIAVENAGDCAEIVKKLLSATTVQQLEGLVPEKTLETLPSVEGKTQVDLSIPDYVVNFFKAPDIKWKANNLAQAFGYRSIDDAINNDVAIAYKIFELILIAKVK